MTLYVADAHAHIQTLVSVVKVATTLEGVIPKRSVLLCVFLRRGGGVGLTSKGY
jgi:hypothetical protein